jgi:general secretion pathway protein N
MAADLNRLATPVLGGAVALFGLLALAQLAGLGRGYSLPVDVAPPPLAGQVDLHEVLPPLPPLEQFAAIRERPLFNPERRPELVEVVLVENGETEPVDETPPPLDVAITGIIITPEVRIAMVRPRGASESVVLREGMPLPGELGAWTLSRVLPRRAVFDGGAGLPPAEVELTVDKTVRSAPPPPVAGDAQVPGQVVQAGEDVQPGDVQSRAAEIRRRIEERRRQMREEAARLSAQESE